MTQLQASQLCEAHDAVCHCCSHHSYEKHESMDTAIALASYYSLVSTIQPPCKLYYHIPHLFGYALSREKVEKPRSLVFSVSP